MCNQKAKVEKRDTKTVTTEITFSFGLPPFFEIELSRAYQWQKPKKEKPSTS
ncbi:MAG: hypothetical protein AAFV69_00420 [Pseudomonadota bacterium]